MYHFIFCVCVCVCVMVQVRIHAGFPGDLKTHAAEIPGGVCRNRPGLCHSNRGRPGVSRTCDHQQIDLAARRKKKRND